MIKNELIVKSIDELRDEIGSLNRTLLDVRYDDFKKVVLTQIQFTISEYSSRFLSLRMETMDCMPSCNFREECKAKLKAMMQ